MCDDDDDDDEEEEEEESCRKIVIKFLKHSVTICTACFNVTNKQVKLFL
jgi:uncharacterized protein YgfB (UPF0149 family)